MKSVFWLPALLVGGLLIGGWGPRVENRDLRDELAKLQKELKDSKGRENEFANMIRMLRIPDRTGEAKAGGAERAKPPTPPPAAPKPDGAVTSPSEQPAEKPKPAEKADRGRDRDSLRDRIKEASDLWRMRSDLARNSFIQNTKLTPEQVARFGTLMEAMNLRIGTEIDQFAAKVKEGGTLTPETGARLFNAVSGAFVLTYDEMDRSMPEGWRSSGGKDFDLVDFVDPEVATPLVDIEDKIEERQDKNRRRRPF